MNTAFSDHRRASTADQTTGQVLLVSESGPVSRPLFCRAVGAGVPLPDQANRAAQLFPERSQ
jgi:hypothetical protein